VATGVTTKGIVRFHLRFGWWSLLLFACLGLSLEAMHGFKVGWYLDVTHETRRLMFRLAHAHGTLLALVHVALAATFAHLGSDAALPRSAHVASRTLCAASLLLPAGFLLGGFGSTGGDPGLGIGLVPLGALAFLTALVSIGLALRGRP
tara:strand:- start:189 stop:635 length:447 start_codon:yes stop_codon:yes gene_type:complete